MSDIKNPSPRPVQPASTDASGKRPSHEVNTKLLQKLEAPELSIEKTVVVEQLKGPSPQEPALPGGGYNPYERSTVKPVAPVARKPAVTQSPTKPSVMPREKPAAALARAGLAWKEIARRL